MFNEDEYGEITDDLYAQRTIYIANYHDRHYPEDDEILGAFFTEEEAKAANEEERQNYVGRYQEGHHRAREHYYGVKLATLETRISVDDLHLLRALEAGECDEDEQNAVFRMVARLLGLSDEDTDAEDK
ncbi:hypothetical protein BcepSauron_353 [Burkholderia phage BcepSauron]|uniref:Uncharacterized protein n=1 Tax=Burkholderia phage BcepSauron TaxID=2530033 RepID=A0A482MNG0_9CAUD|nr:hypothetical protein H1O17_gp353 [Burkholderia phage BcepSauron]QBQ74733.1 hypothetical protein BcepSauron_353 [Burkholderia phage BcepSauron]